MTVERSFFENYWVLSFHIDKVYKKV